MRRLLPLCLLACSSEPQPESVRAPVAEEIALMGVIEEALSRPGSPRQPGSAEVEGMIAIPGAWVSLGPSSEQGGPKGGAGLGPPGEGGARNHGEGGSARGPGGPPPVGGVTPMSSLEIPEDPAAWESFGGMLLEPRLVWVRDFEIDATEVSRSQYKRFLDATGYRPPFVDEPWANEGWNWNRTVPPEGTEEHPVVLTNFYDAVEFCEWAGKRLPTEAEWQLAALGARAMGRSFPWEGGYDGSLLNHGKMDEPNFDDSDGWLYTSPVGQYPQGRSERGLDDAFGNAWEFTSDWRKDDWDDASGSRTENGWLDVQMKGPGLYVAVRGGAYFFDICPNPAGERNHFLPELRRKTSGFRCAR